VDSSIPPPPPSGHAAARLRPWYLIAAMMVTWFAGMYGFMSGFETARFLRSGRIPDITAVPQAGAAAEALATALGELLRAQIANARVTFPLAVGQAILSGLLIIASGLAMSGRRGSRGLVLQALLANALFAVAAYVLTRPVRAAYVDELVHAAQKLPAGSPQRAQFGSSPVVWWIWRIRLVLLDLAPLAVAWWAVTRERSKAFFDAVARATEGAEDP
jgi:hypothetical protein